MKSNVSQSVLLHPHLELIASKVIMEEKAGGFCGIFLGPSVTSVYNS